MVVPHKAERMNAKLQLAEELYHQTRLKKEKLREKKIRFINLKTKPFSALTYLIDWVTYALVLAVAMVWGYLRIPRKTDFSIYDITLMHAYVPENKTYAPIGYLIIITAIVSPIIIVVVSYFTSKKETFKRKYWDVHCALLALLGSVALQLAVVVIMKNTSGVPRPDFLKRCLPNYYLAPVQDTLATMQICLQGNKALINEGFRSFPSGHASTIFAAQTVMGLYLAGKLRLWDCRGFSWKIVVAVVHPLATALAISVSRISDNRHKLADVVVGGAIGVFFGVLFYSFYFPLVGDGYGRAYPPRRFVLRAHYNERDTLEISHYTIDDVIKPFGMFNPPFANMASNVDVLQMFQVKDPNVDGMEGDLENQLEQRSLPPFPVKEVEIAKIDDTIRARTVGSVKL